ncbi:long-chain fatty acid-CoA ligase [Apophysomyces ossiformis]|uniref:Long-chain fatty acid-CoA ligase n=1 Tax=Apophysomyces ossiformis TaxID=679940 RepID=A0A8H7BUD1_9FUNG|nr:long-chain fatty acid-CoA ligase [Apophysomyces ossiformis]
MCAIMTPEQFSIGPVGGPVPCCEIKLVDVPEANYLSTNEPKPQGEIWVRGSSIASGYWKRDDLTKETITEDGWLRTGDVGEWNEDGTLSVIDRIKNLVKLSHGEYIALEKLESVYKTALGVANVCVYGDSLRPRPVALVVPVEGKLRKMAQELGLNSEGALEELCANEAIRKEYLNQLLAQAKSAQLKPAEIVCDVHLCEEDWTSENGMLTAAQKLKRHDINKKYKEQLDKMNAAQKA